MKAKIRDYLLLGLIAVAPTTITLWVLWKAIRWLDSLLPESLQQYPGIGLILGFFILLWTGMLAKTFTGNILNRFSESLMARVPVARSVYSLSKQISHALFSKDSNKSFKRVVYLPFMSSKARTIGFVTAEIASEGKLYVFVPTAPNPTSGYVLILNSADVETAPYGVDEAFKIVVSCGATAQR